MLPVLVLNNDNYTIYKLTDKKNHVYYLCIPNNNEMKYQVFIGFSGMNDTTNHVKDTYDRLFTSNKQAIYVTMTIDNDKMHEAATDNDNKLYEEILEKIKSVLSDAYQVIIKEKLAIISQQIIAIKQNIDDAKFIDWLEIEMPEFITSESFENITMLNYNKYNETTEISTTNPGDSGNSHTANNSVEIKSNYTKKKVPKAKQHKGNVKVIMLVFLLYLLLGIGFIILMIKLK